MSVLAANRPDSWDFPLFVHVTGAMILVGGLVAGAAALAFARGDARTLRLGYWSLVGVALPGWVIMRLGAEWIYTREGWDKVPSKFDPTWLSTGFIVADTGALLLIVSLIAGGFGVRRLGQGKGAGLLRATLFLSVVLLAACVVAVWAMAGKPT
jgi:hypothetical protein